MAIVINNGGAKFFNYIFEMPTNQNMNTEISKYASTTQLSLN